MAERSWCLHTRIYVISFYVLALLLAQPLIFFFIYITWPFDFLFVFINILLFIPLIMLLRYVESPDQTSSWVLKKNPIVLLVFILPVGVYWLSHILSGWIQTGWDTPIYVFLAKILREQGILALLDQQTGYNFLYPLLLSAFSPFDPMLFATNILLPFIFAVSLILLMIIIAGKWFRRTSTALAAGLTTATWLTLYRFMADLYKALFSLMLFLIVVYFTIQTYNEENASSNRSLYVSLIALFVMSFVQLEMALLTAGIVVLFHLYYVIRKRDSSQNTYFVIVLIFMIFALSFALFLSLNFSSYFLGFIHTLPPLEAWNIFLNFGFPFYIWVLMGVVTLILYLRKRDDPYVVFILIWTIIIVTLVFAGYLFPYPLRKFSQRLTYLFPTPLLVAAGFHGFITLWEDCTLPNISPRWRRVLSKRKTEGLILVSIFLTGAIFIPAQASIHMRPFLTTEAHNQLMWLNQNAQVNSSSIFIINADSGVRAQLFERWVGAFFGPHMTYKGVLHFFILLQKTPYPSDLYAFRHEDPIDYALLKNMSLSELLEFRDVYLLDELYGKIKPYSTERWLTPFELSLLIELQPGIYRLNSSRAIEYASTGYQIACGREAYYHQNNWAPRIHNWTWSEISMVYILGTNFTSNLKYYLPVQIGVNNISIHFFDGSVNSSPLEFFINGTLLLSLNYTSTYQPRSVIIQFPVVSNGIADLQISIKNPENGFAQLDYMEILFKI